MKSAGVSMLMLMLMGNLSQKTRPAGESSLQPLLFVRQRNSIVRQCATWLFPPISGSSLEKKPKTSCSSRTLYCPRPPAFFSSQKMRKGPGVQIPASLPLTKSFFVTSFWQFIDIETEKINIKNRLRNRVYLAFFFGKNCFSWCAEFHV